MNKILQATLRCNQKWPLLGFARNFAYKSDLSPEVLYPKSKQQLFTPSPPSVLPFIHMSVENRAFILIEHY